MRHRDVHLVPLLGAGAHTHPRHGGCLLDLVSTLPGGAWTDHPPGIDPVLGVLARAVNDATSSDQRPALAPRIPWLAALPPGTPRRGRRRGRDRLHPGRTGRRGPRVGGGPDPGRGHRHRSLNPRR